MIRFSIRTLLFFTTVLVAWLLMLREPTSQTAAGVVAGFVLYVALLIWFVYRHRNDGTEIMAEKRKQEEQAD